MLIHQKDVHRDARHRPYHLRCFTDDVVISLEVEKQGVTVGEDKVKELMLACNLSWGYQKHKEDCRGRH